MANPIAAMQHADPLAREPVPLPRPALVPPHGQDLPEIRVNNRQLRDVSADCLEAIRNSNDPAYLFSRAGEPVHVVSDEAGRSQITPVVSAYLRGQLTRCADFVSLDGDNRTRVNPPLAAVRDLLSRPITELALPPLVRISETPVLRPDGSLVTVPGYDPASRMYYVPKPGLEISPIPEPPSMKDVKAAVDQIGDVIGDFPFKDRASRANAFGMLLTPILRPAILGCVPVALIDAPQPGTGKGLFTEVVAIVSSGSSAALRAAPRRNEDEWRKALTAAIYGGLQLTIWDNVEDELESPALAAVVTAETWSDRILGRTETITMPQRTVFIVTGNNISLGGDLARRCYSIRLDAAMPRPWIGRTFRHPDLKGWVRQNRGNLLGALLTIARAWYVAGRPPSNTPVLGSFEEWSKIVGGILTLAGIEGFLDNLQLLYDQSDRADAQWTAYLGAIHDAFGDQSFTVKQLIQREIYGIGPICDAKPDDLDGAKDNSRSIGRAFLRRLGRRHGESGLYLEKAGEAGGVVQWRVRTT